MDKILRAALAAIPQVNGQVFPMVGDETAKDTWIVYEQIQNIPLMALDGDTGCATVVYDIHAASNRYGIAQEVMLAASKACLSLEGTETDDVLIQTVTIENQTPQGWSEKHDAYVSTLTISCFISH